MGNDTVLAEALSEDQHDLLVSLMKVTMTIRASNVGPQYRFLKPSLIIFLLVSQFHVYLSCVKTCLA